MDDKNKLPEDFFNELLDATEVLYKHSRIFKNHGYKNWGYSISSTSLVKNKPVIVGLNWGVSKEGHSGLRQPYPNGLFNDIKDLGSFSRVKGLFDKYFVEGLNSVQTNYCFFRSENERQVLEDLDICNDLFIRLITYLEPSSIIVFSSKLHDYLFNIKRILNVTPSSPITYALGKRKLTLIAFKGKITIDKRSIKYYCLPHPNYPITDMARKSAWEYCFPND